MSRISSASKECPFAMAICRAEIIQRSTDQKKSDPQESFAHTESPHPKAKTCYGGRDCFRTSISSGSHQISHNLDMTHACSPVQGCLSVQYARVYHHVKDSPRGTYGKSAQKTACARAHSCRERAVGKVRTRRRSQCWGLHRSAAAASQPIDAPVHLLETRRRKTFAKTFS